MRDLPAGWAWTTVGDVSDVVGGIQKSPKRKPADNAYPMIRAGNVGAGGLDLEDVHTIELFDGEIGRLRLEAGDCLIVEGSGSVSQVGRAAMWGGEIPDCVHQNHVIRARTRIDPRYLTYWMLSPDARDQIESVASSTSGLSVLSGRKVKALEVPLPPMGEQQRIVAAMEEQLSSLSAAESAVDAAEVRISGLQAKVAEDLLPHAPSRTLGEIASDRCYGTSARCAYDGRGPAVIRIPNLQNEEVTLGDLKYAVDPAAVDPRTDLREQDLLFVRTNGSRSLIGRAAVARKAAGLSFASYLIRYRFVDTVDPAYVSAVVTAPSVRRVLEDLAATTAGQYNLSISKLDSVAIPVPSVAEQQEVARRHSELRAGSGRLAADLRRSRTRAAGLRRSILAAAFAGQLVPQDPHDEPASLLLDRIRAERPPTTAKGSSRRRVAGSAP